MLLTLYCYSMRMWLCSEAGVYLSPSISLNVALLCCRKRGLKTDCQSGVSRWKRVEVDCFCRLENVWLITSGSFFVLVSLNWNRVPAYMERHSSLYGTSFQFIWNIIPSYMESCSSLAIPRRKVNKALFGT